MQQLQKSKLHCNSVFGKRSVLFSGARRHDFESGGGGQFCERSKQENFFDTPPLFGQWGGQNIA